MELNGCQLLINSKENQVASLEGSAGIRKVIIVTLFISNNNNNNNIYVFTHYFNLFLDNTLYFGGRYFEAISAYFSAVSSTAHLKLFPKTFILSPRILFLISIS